MALKFAVSLLALAPFITARFATTPISQLRNDIEPKLSKRDVDPATLYPAYNLPVPVDHFHNESKYAPHSDAKFPLRYWFDGSYYKPGGPVIVLESGETSGVGRLPFLQKGIIAQIAQATNGVAVVLEHRYYGTSMPTSDLSTKNLRFLTTEQALADTAYFAKNVVFKGLEKYKLTAPHAPYIAYGGSYAGAFVAFLRVLYPDVFFGAISSSGVTEAIYDYWQYYEPVRQYGPPDCISTTQKVTNIVDNIIIGKNQKELTTKLKAAFGLQDLTYNNDFANVLSYGIGGWQGRNWDPALNDPSFYQYCDNITAPSVNFPATASQTATVKNLIAVGGYAKESQALTTKMLNFINYVNTTQVVPCASSGQTQDQCFSNNNATFYAQDDLSQTWRSWPYQYCTQWGYLQTGSGVPKSELPLISRLIDLPYESLICKDAFGITTPPDVNAINKYGGYDIAYDRLAIVGGEADPWRPVTPLAQDAKNRVSTTQEPVILIQGAVHHWDENGVFANETKAGLPPAPVKEAQKCEVEFVGEWLKEWHRR